MNQATAGNSSPKSYDAKSAGDLSPDEKILTEARDRFRLCCDYNSQIRAEALEDLKFFKGDQWNSLILRERTEDRRPALTINKLPSVAQQVINQIRQNRPSIKVRPVDNLTDIKTADIINGMVRHIQANNDVKSAVDTALEYAVICGQGYFRILTEYCDEKSMDQEIKVERIDNPMCCYFPIPLCHAADWSDAPYVFVRTSISKDEFKRKYGEKAQEEIQNWSANGIGDPNWTEENLVWLAEYFVIEEETKTLYQLDDGSITWDKPDGTISINDMGMAMPSPQVIKERESTIRKVQWYLMSESTILEREEWPCQYIPIIPVLGWELNIDGQKNYMSLIRHAKDPQRLYNYFKSMEAEIIALAPKAPWLVAAGQIENFENDWKVANSKNLAYLEYNPLTTQGGVAVPAPQRIDPAQVPMAAINALKEASDDIKATTGVFDASMGAQGNETSGRAIVARQKQGDNATWHFQDNLVRAVRHMGRIFVDLIPKIYDTPRTVRILGEDQANDIALVNQLHHDESAGEDMIYDLTVGKYDVTVDVGPSYESKRMETAENLTNIIQAIPQIGQVCSDILVRNLDFPGAQELADRLKRTVPPNLLEDPNEKPNKISEAEIQMIVQDLQGLQQQLQMAGQEKQQMLKMINDLQGMLKDKQEAIQAKQDSDIIRANAGVQVAQMRLQQESMKMEHEGVKHTVDSAIQLNMANQKMLEPDYTGLEEKTSPSR
jgi:hypothetical protein